VLPGSELQARYGTVSGSPSQLDLAAEAALIRLVVDLAPRCTLAHDVSDGGLAVALAEAALHSGLGARLDLALDPISLFGEGPGRVILALPPDESEHLPSIEGVAIHRIGEVGGSELLGVTLTDLRSAWERE
jgi:phosphoribosylformylglycinamidine synthase